jgi:hypothetical protein
LACREDARLKTQDSRPKTEEIPTDYLVDCRGGKCIIIIAFCMGIKGD